MRLHVRVLCPAAAAILASGCAAYSRRSLPTASDALSEVAAVSSASAVQVPGLGLSTSAPQALDVTDAMTLAVLNDPDLKTARLEAGVAKAQLFAAGLLPDPHLAAGVGRGPELTGYSLGVSEDIQAFVLRPAAQAQARARRSQVDLAILWKEWQTAVAAGRLFIRVRKDEDLRAVIERSRGLLAQQYELDSADFQQNAAAVRKVAAALTVLSDADARLRRVQLDADAARHELNYLLGLDPEARPSLRAATGPAPALSREEFKDALGALAAHRVDLLALQAGYESQEQRLRAAVRAQFPALTAGFRWGRGAADGVHAVSLSVEVGLPVFNGNRGRVAIERASREALRADYQARLDQAQSQADGLWRSTTIMTEQLARLRAQTAALKAMAGVAQQQFRSGEMDTGAYVGLETSLLQDEEESIRLRAALDADRLALNALLGTPFARPP